MNKKLLFLLLFLVLSVGIYFISAQLNNSNFYTEAEILEQEIAEPVPDTAALIPAEPTLLFGIPADSFEIVQDKVKRNQNLSEILLPFNIDYTTISTLANNSRKVFDVRRMAANKNITIFCEKDSARTARYLVYEPSLTEYVVFNLQRLHFCKRLNQKEVTSRRKKYLWHH